MKSDQESTNRLRQLAQEVFRAGLRAADPRRAVQEGLELSVAGRPIIAGKELSSTATLRIVAIGKASVSMAEAVTELLPIALFPGPGVAAVNPENHRDLERFEVFASGHPVPDAVGLAAAAAVEEYLTGSREEDALLVLISGGGSALLPSLAPGISLEDKVETTRLLLGSGAPIQEINTVRKHLSTLKGGGLARLGSPARVEALILSDVMGDDLSSIAGGPTAPDPTTFQDVEEILTRYDLNSELSPSVRSRIEQGARGEIADTPTAENPVFERVANRLVGSNSQSLAAARSRAADLGFETLVFSEALVGEAREAAVLIESSVRRNWKGERPLAVLAGGETTVTLKGRGRGGRNQEMALAFALRVEAHTLPGEWVFLSGATDGRDGPTDAAGGVVDAGTVERIRCARLDPAAELDENNSYAALFAAGDLLMTGATGTNVADLQILLLSPGSQPGLE
jgi:hydroxypyruvate reductase